MIIKSFIVEEPEQIEVFYNELTGNIWVCDFTKTARESIVSILKAKFNDIGVENVTPIGFDEYDQVMMWGVNLPISLD